MPEFNDSEFRKLFQAAGHVQPGRDLTDRVMARVAVTRLAERTAVPPLIGKAGWIGIALAATLAIIIGILTAGSTSSAAALPFAEAIATWSGQLRLPDGNWTHWVIGGSVLALFFTALVKRLERGAAA